MPSSNILRKLVINLGTSLITLISIVTANTMLQALVSLPLAGLILRGIKLMGSATLFVSTALASAIHRSFPPKHDRPEDFERLYLEGPYKLCRHPFYFFLMLIQISIPLIFLSVPGLVMTILLIPAWFILVKTEERELVSYWGAKYLEYVRSVPMLIPIKLSFFKRRRNDR